MFRTCHHNRFGDLEMTTQNCLYSTVQRRTYYNDCIEETHCLYMSIEATC